MAKLAIRAVLAKACQVVMTRCLDHMTMPAFRAVPTKATRKVRALVALLLGIDVPVRTLGVGTLTELGVEETFGHAVVVYGM